MKLPKSKKMQNNNKLLACVFLCKNTAKNKLLNISMCSKDQVLIIFNWQKSFKILNEINDFWFY